MTISERRVMFARLIDAVFVKKGTGSGADRAHICLRGEAPLQLPTRGDKRVFPMRFDPNECRHPTSAHLRVRHPPQWSERRLKRELVAFLGDRNAFPSYAEFALAGQLRLWDQLRRRRGAASWAQELRLTYRAQHHRAPVDWTEEQVRDALAPFVAGRPGWPSWADFRGARLTTLRRAVNEHGGATRWAAEFDLALSDKKKSPRPKWTDERINQSLAAFVGEDGRWPSSREFKAAGLSGLYQAMQRGNGIRAWARRASAADQERTA
jgi:hypothetical protein